MNERLQWFRDRIGERVFRNELPCNCHTCQNVHANGLKIENDTVAECLYDFEGCSSDSPNPIRYFDTREEVEEFEKQLKLKEI